MFPPMTRLARLRRRIARAEGSQLVEFALALPALLILAVGILDFGTAFNLRQILNNAAREGARMGAESSRLALSQTNPADVQTVCTAVVQYLQNANVDTSFIAKITGSPPQCPNMTNAGNFTWTLYSSGTYGLKIERQVPITLASGTVLLATRVTLNYPYNWTFGFNKVIQIAAPGGAYAGTVGIATDSTIEDLQ